MDSPEIGMVLKECDLFGDFIRHPDVISIQEGNVRASGQANAMVARRAGPRIILTYV